MEIPIRDKAHKWASVTGQGRKEKRGKYVIQRADGRVVAEAPAEVIIIRHYPVPANHCNPYFILCRFFVAGREERLRAPEITGPPR